MCTEFNFASLQTLKTRPDQAFQPTNTSFLCPELGKGAPVRRSFQAAWFNWISEAAVTTARTEMKYFGSKVASEATSKHLI